MHQTAPSAAQPGNIFVKPRSIIGNKLIFRNAEVDDAEFILSLRTDKNKSKYLSSTSPDIAKQICWIEQYANDASQIYFIIENQEHERVGTVRLYDQKGDSFCWGSWIKKDGAPSGFAIESALIVYHFALYLGFEKSHFDVRKQNVSVCQFHERFGAVMVGQSEHDFYYTINRESIEKALDKFKKFLPDGIIVNLDAGRDQALDR
jgi:RimJ/RimL family protein N-acetyltransferase